MDRLRQTPLLGHLVTALLLASSHLTMAYDLDPNSPDSIKSISKQITQDMLSFYSGNKPGGTPGLLPDPYYWWEAGAMMGALIDYWYYTGDDSYVDLTRQGLVFQVGETNDYMPRNQTRTEGNDDQGFWGLAVMSAAEYNFPNPDPSQPQWLALAQAVFNTQAARWDQADCAGGLRWQIFTWNNGYNYKNSISQACFFALGARLALYTGNSSYADWAEKTWDWMMDVKFIDQQTWYVYDGAGIETNCTDIVPYQFSYNAGGFILGAAAMYNFTEDPKWKSRLDNLLEGSKVFFTGPQKNIMTEVACEPVNLCNLDQQSFKAYLSRWLAAITKWAPYTYDVVMPYLRASAVAAANQCVGGQNGRMCGLVWNQNKYDGSTGVGQQMAAMEVTLSCMIKDLDPPVTDQTGGTSKGDPGGGGDDIGRTEPAGPHYKTLTAGDRVGAAIVTIVIIASLAATLFCLCLDETSKKSPLDQFKGFHSSASAAVATFAAGGGAAAALGRKRGDKEFNEKGGVAKGSRSDGSTQNTSETLATEATPVTIGPVRHQSEGVQRRLSNMPRGWPHNPSVRSSIMAESTIGRSSSEPVNHSGNDSRQTPSSETVHE